MRPTSKVKKIRILKRLFSGETYPCAARNENSSTSTIKKIFDEFAGCAASSSLGEAAENYSVQEEIEILREIACEARNADASFTELLAAARLLLLLKKLGLSPVQLEDTINTLDKHKSKFGDFIQFALRLATLEEETGKTYNGVISEYENTKKKIAELSEEMDQTRAKFSEEKCVAKKKITSLNNEIQLLDDKIKTKESQLKRLDQRAQEAQTVLDEFEKAKMELYTYGIGYGDFTIVKNFLIDIQKLEGNPVRAVQMIKECDSLENKLSQLRIEIRDNQKHQRLEQLVHERIIVELEKTKNELKDRIVKDENRIGTLRTEKNDLMEEITKLKETRQHLACQVDGLQKMLAERLGVQPDIDVIYETIPIRKKELKELEEKIGDRKFVLAVAVALKNLLQKKPADRQVLVKWLELGSALPGFDYSDRWVREKIIELLAQEGFVPQNKLDSTIKSMKKEIQQTKESASFWQKRATNKSNQLFESLDLLKKAQDTIHKQQMDKQIEELAASIANFIITVQTRLAQENHTGYPPAV